MIDSIRIGSYVLSFGYFVVMMLVVVVEKEEVEEIEVMGCVFLVGCFESLFFFRVRAQKCDGGCFWLSGSNPIIGLEVHVGEDGVT